MSNKTLFAGLMFDPTEKAEKAGVTLIDLAGPPSAEGKRPIVLFDLDGTLADDEHRKGELECKSADRYERYYSKMSKDAIYPKTVNRMIELWNEGLQIGIITGRPDEYAVTTMRWLHKYDLLQFVSFLFFRHAGNFDPAPTYKADAIGLLALNGDTVVQMYDDDVRVKQAFEESKLPFEVLDLNKVEIARV